MSYNDFSRAKHPEGVLLEAMRVTSRGILLECTEGYTERVTVASDRTPQECGVYTEG